MTQPKGTTMETGNLPFIDSHIHFWDLHHPPVEYAWLAPASTHPMIGDIDGLKVQRFAVEEFVAQSRFQNVLKAVHVGVSTNPDPVIETRWLQSLADDGGFPHGIVARCDLGDPAAGETLLRHMESPNMRGVRDHGQPGSFESPAWRDGYRRLAEADLVFCHEVGLDRIPEAVQLIGAVPEVRFSLDHTAMPRAFDADYFEAWRAGLHAMAAMPNVVIKISAIGQWGGRWTVDSIRPWVMTCIEAFGSKRAYFGSNFPVDGLFSTYTDLIGTFRYLIRDFTEAEQRDLLANNAERIYRL